MKIAQITDLHLTPHKELANDIDVWANFEKVLTHIQLQLPDLLVVSGDICYDIGDESTYKEVKQRLDQLQIPYYVVSGNHDDSVALGKVFGYTTKNDKIEPYKINFDGIHIHFWDSWDGIVEPSWIDNLGATSLVFVHHPLILGDCQFMDTKYALQNMDEVTQKLEKTAFSHYFFHGHYHLDKSIHTSKHHFFITPSTFFQLDDTASDFKIASTQIGYRWIEMQKHHLLTKVIYL
ncbi:MAG: metallophosphoesterase [Raineya sp.]|jgi:Icc protein|nr:metallophosphoesterase [Raineya sp.]